MVHQTCNQTYFYVVFNSYLVYKHLKLYEKVDYPTYKENLNVKLVGFVRAPRNNAGRKTKLEKDRFRLQNVCERFPEMGEGKSQICSVHKEKSHIEGPVSRCKKSENL